MTMGLAILLIAGCGPPIRDSSESADNLKMLGIACYVYMYNHPDELWPPLASEPGRLSMAAGSIHPAYVSDTSVFISPANPQRDQLEALAATSPIAVIDDHSYWYLGYALPNEAIGLAFIKAYRDQVALGKSFDSALPLPSPMSWTTEEFDFESTVISRLGRGFVVGHDYRRKPGGPIDGATIASGIPVMIERPGFFKTHSNVMFLDGHVEFMPYPGEFPMTRAFISGLESLDALEAVSEDAQN